MNWKDKGKTKLEFSLVRTFGLGVIFTVEQDEFSAEVFHFDETKIESRTEKIEEDNKFYDDNWIQKSIKLWSSYYNENLSPADVIDISHNMVGFFSLLKKWDDDAKQKIRNCV